MKLAQVARSRGHLRFFIMEFPTRFDPKEAEDRIYGMWSDGGYFRADAETSKPSFTIVIPPPNVTGSLHMGHALNTTLQDILIRSKRMQGYEALYLPGTDHAGIATQTVVEKKLRKEGKRRQEMGREAFLEKVWEWKQEYGSRILYQLRRLGCSCDWDRTRFTMDEGYSRAIRCIFVSLFKKGFIYRGNYTVNWCVRCKTALSDLEVERKEEKGNLWVLRYPVKEGGSLLVATTRPETMLGDTAVAVHPKDDRFRDYIGKTVLLPFVDREIPIVADNSVDREFGTGAVKITPAHDANDFELGRRHELPTVVVMDNGGLMNENAGSFQGLDRFECRKQIAQAMEEKGLLERVEDYDSHAGICYRCSTIIEPYLSEQWFVRMGALAAPAVTAVKDGDVTFHPTRWSKVYLDWMESIRDWCISRQLWWGHRIPVWYCECGEIISAVIDPESCPACGKEELRQDPDVLDTWFSSALWPFATLGWPEETADLEKFYPTQVLVTDRGIINLWVARMIMTGLEFRGELPFDDVIIHATIMDDQGQRMSKSKGTGIDPLDLIDQFGTDALRFALAMLSTGTQDFRFGRKLSVARTEMARNFVTKLWNASRYVSQQVGSVEPKPPKSPGLEDRWLLSRLATVSDLVSERLETFDFGSVAQMLYNFVWDEFCGWYIELTKSRQEEEAVKQTLSYSLNVILRLLHPIMPFVTEEIWQKYRELGGKMNETIMTAPWPEVPSRLRDENLEARMELVFECVTAIREKRNIHKVPVKKALNATFSVSKEDLRELLEAGKEILRSQANLDEVTIGVDLQRPRGVVNAVTSRVAIYIPRDADFDTAGEVVRVEKDLAGRQARSERIGKQLLNEAFRKAKPELVAKLEEEAGSLTEEISRLQENLAELREAK